MNRRGLTLIELLVVIAIIAVRIARSYHPGGVNALLGDGSVRFVKGSINGVTWRALGTVGGGKVVAGDAF